MSQPFDSRCRPPRRSAPKPGASSRYAAGSSPRSGALLPLGALLGALALPSTAGAISRTEVMVRAKAFAYHPWTCATANLTADCDSGYHSAYVVGDFMGLPYDWGGYMSLFQFDQRIEDGQGAGSYPADGILDCTAGLDCSGYVSQCWGADHNTTSSMADISSTLPNVDALVVGDALNDAGYHVVLFSHLLGNGDPVFYESVFYNVHISMPGWSWVDGFDPIRYDLITGTSASNPSGTPENPIVISSFPYTNSNDTGDSMSDVLDGCGAAAGTGETGPEVIYQVTFTEPGSLTVSVQDDAAADIDVHLYTSMSTSDCIARHDSSFTTGVDCGTYYIVADSFSSGGTSYPGAYTLNATFTPSGGNCGSGPPSYDYEAGPGEPCMNEEFCNENLGAGTCITTPDETFCSKPCEGAADCADFPGGCCGEVTSGETYCFIAAYCGGGEGGSGTGGSGTGASSTGGGSSQGGFGTGGFATGGAGTGNTGTGNSGTGNGSSSDDDDDGGNEGGCACTVRGRSQSASDPRGAQPWLLAALAFGASLRRRLRRKPVAD